MQRLRDHPPAGETGSRSMSACGVARPCVFLVFAVIALVCFLGLGSQPLYETDEGFAGTRADSFLRHGGWVLSYDDANEDEPQFRKPPLLYWCVAVLLKLLGHNLWAVRLPTALAGFLSALLLYRVARGALGESVALAAALLTCTVPLFVHHIRTARLDLPVICALLAGLAAALLLPQSWWRPVAVGACGGAAVMLKAGGGVAAVAIPVLAGLVRQRLSRRAWAEALVALATAALLPALWYWAVPAEHRARVVQDLLVGEAAKRVKGTRRAWKRLSVGSGVLMLIMRWQLPAAACGMALALVRSWHRRELALWLGVTLLVTVPLLWVYAAMVPNYPHYLLLAVPFLLSFTAYFAHEVTASRAAALVLIPFAVAVATIDAADPWRLAPLAAAAVAFLAVWTQWTAARPRRRLIVGGALLAAIAGASWHSAAAWSLHPFAYQQPRPEIVPLMRQSAALIPANGKLVVEDGFKVHSMLFYGRRALQGHSYWLLTGLVPGEVRYGVFQGDPLRGIPGVAEEVVARSGPWRLVRLTVAAGDRPLRGILLADEQQRPALANTLGLLRVDCEPFEQGFLIRNVPEEAAAGFAAGGQQLRALLPAGAERPGGEAAAVTIDAGESLLLDLGAPRRISGIEILPVRRQNAVAGWIVQGEAADGSWSELVRIEGLLEPRLAVVGPNLHRRVRAAVRARFPAAAVRRVRLQRTAEPFVIEEVRLLEPRPGR